MAAFPSTVLNDEEAIVYLGNVTQNTGVVFAATGATNTIPAVVAIVYASTQAAATVTLPSAAAVVASLANPQVGSRLSFDIINRNTGLLTIAAGTGDTLIGTATMATNTAQLVRGFVTNATVGSEAVTFYTVLNTAS